MGPVIEVVVSLLVFALIALVILRLGRYLIMKGANYRIVKVSTVGMIPWYRVDIMLDEFPLPKWYPTIDHKTERPYCFITFEAAQEYISKEAGLPVLPYVKFGEAQTQTKVLSTFRVRK